jgi:hypothetical protein
MQGTAFLCERFYRLRAFYIVSSLYVHFFSVGCYGKELSVGGVYVCNDDRSHLFAKEILQCSPFYNKFSRQFSTPCNIYDPYFSFFFFSLSISHTSFHFSSLANSHFFCSFAFDILPRGNFFFTSHFLILFYFAHSLTHLCCFTHCRSFTSYYDNVLFARSRKLVAD